MKASRRPYSIDNYILIPFVVPAIIGLNDDPIPTILVKQLERWSYQSIHAAIISSGALGAQNQSSGEIRGSSRSTRNCEIISTLRTSDLFRGWMAVIRFLVYPFSRTWKVFLRYSASRASSLICLETRRRAPVWFSETSLGIWHTLGGRSMKRKAATSPCQRSEFPF